MDEPMGEAHDTVELIIPNLNWRYSGVTATNRAVAPLLARVVIAHDQPSSST